MSSYGVTRPQCIKYFGINPSFAVIGLTLHVAAVGLTANLDMILPKLLYWQHQAITWTNAYLSSSRGYGIHLRAIAQEMLYRSILDMSLKIFDLRLEPYLSGADKLTHCGIATP